MKIKKKIEKIIFYVFIEGYVKMIDFSSEGRRNGTSDSCL